MSKGNAKNILLLLLAAEYLSLVFYFLPNLGPAVFVLIVFALAFATWKNLKAGIMIMFAELVIGSKGYLFYLDLGGFKLSIRIAIWTVVMGVWAYSLFMNAVQRRRSLAGRKDDPQQEDADKALFTESGFFRAFLALGLAAAWGVLNGILQGNDPKNLIMDANAWVFFGALFPVYGALRTKDDIKDLWDLIKVCAVWIAIKTIALLYLFSHFDSFALYPVYRWVRDTGVGEITRTPEGFFRIFFQSHIYVLAAFFGVVLSGLGEVTAQYALSVRKAFGAGRMRLASGILLACVILIGFSRSNWVGLACGALAIGIALSLLAGLRKASAAIGSIVLLLACGALLAFAVIKFPLPLSRAGYDAGALLAQRASELSEEAGAASRWALLPVLAGEVVSAPILGAGFGRTVTYRSSDPRVLEADPSGLYTTYAFEWGWLDIWLKLGLFGLTAYIWLIFNLLRTAYALLRSGGGGKRMAGQPPERVLASDLPIAGTLLAILPALCAVHFFSPYLNHPLGIGLVVAAAVALDRLVRES